ncbi:PadR family transcriptional regulator, partial [Nostoc sp. NIES-2111]
MSDKNALPSVAPGGWIVLGLLVQEAPQSGYDLASRATRGIAHFWPITKAQVYAELPRLEAAGLASSELVMQVGVPDKRLYRPTTAGKEAFKRWLATESFGEAKLRHPLLMQLWFAEQGVASTFATQCQQHRDALAAQAAHFSGLIDKL